MNRSSQGEQDNVSWDVTKVRLGARGLDLRQPIDPGSLTELLNARFLDQQTVERRDGYSGLRARDASGYPLVLDNLDHPVSVAMTPTGWVYGHGQQLLQHQYTRQNAHLPVPGVARGTFSFEGANVVWTGDRLLIMREDGYPALGQSAHWNVDNITTPLNRGIPAYLPVVTDSTPIDTVNGVYVETCLTDTMRFVAATTGTVTAWVTHRDTGALVNKTSLGGGANSCDIRVHQSGAYVFVLWRDSIARTLSYAYWSGDAWVTSLSIGSACDAYDVVPVQGGFHVLWRDGADLYVGRFAGHQTQGSPYPFGKKLTAFTYSGSTNTPNGPVALDVDVDGGLVVVYEANGVAPAGLYARSYSSSAVQTSVYQLSTSTTWNAGVTVKFRGLSRSTGSQTRAYDFDVYAGRTASAAVYFWEKGNAAINSTQFNAEVVSRAFRVGDRTFCWMRATNSSTMYLVAGGNTVLVCGMADREESGQRNLAGTVRAISQVVPDPRDQYAFTFARPFLTGQNYTRGGNARIGDMAFLPSLSAAQYGKSVYIAASLVRTWDGKELGDAGFHDYPVVTTSVFGNSGGSLKQNSTYQYRVYPVRYNARGERFQGAALTHTSSTGAGASGDSCKLTLTINTIPMTNHSDVVFEVYRTEGGLSAFRLEGTVANDKTAATVTFVSTMADTALEVQPADPHKTGVGNIEELEEFGPLGCQFLAVAADRLWGAGGQVPQGRVQFSKLKETVEGAGFDALAGWQEIDCQGGTVTSICGYADSALVVFERNKLYVLFGSGPDNDGNGAFSTPQLTLADGATTHLGTIETQDGVLFWGEDGPRMLTPAFKVENISDQVRPLSETMTPSGVQIDRARREVVWFTEEGTALLLNYAGQGTRWAEWSGLKIAGCSDSALVTTDGVLLTQDSKAIGDFGVPFEFAGETGELDAEQLLLGRTLLREVGLVGQYLGEHRLRLKVFYNGSPMWTDEWVWSPKTNTWLSTIDDVANLTPAQVDALNAKDQSGKYAVHKRTSRHECSSFRIGWSDMGAFRPTYRLHQLVFELGARGGLTRLSASTFSRS